MKTQSKHVHEYTLGKSGKVITCVCGKFRHVCECCHELPEDCNCLGPSIKDQIITEKLTMKTQTKQTHTVACGCFTTGRKNEVVQCNLHAAAPKLLDTLREILNLTDNEFEESHTVYKEARKAIANAEGR